MDAPTPGPADATPIRSDVRRVAAGQPEGRTDPSPAGVIDFDAPCRGCGYNVRGRLLNDTCPECAAPIRMALEPDTLSYASPRWLTQLARGVVWTLTGMALFIPALLVMFVTAGLRAPTVVGDVMLIAAAVTRCAGVWLLTTPDPAAAHGRSQPRSGLIVRITAPLSVAAVIVAATPTAGAMTLLGAAVQGLAVPAIVAEHLAMLVWLHRLGARIPTSPLADLAGTMARRFAQAMVVVLGLSLLYALAIALLSPPATAGGVGMQVGLAAGLAAILAAVVCFVFAVLFVLLLLRFRAALTGAAHAARDTWAHAVTPRPAEQMAEGARWT